MRLILRRTFASWFMINACDLYGQCPLRERLQVADNSIKRP